MSSFHLLDYLVVAAYFILVLLLGRLASRGATTGEGFFLAGRKLGKLYQFFLNFGNSADASGAASTASVVYQQGVSGVWVGFQAIFLNPYYWFLYPWFRRVRLTTMADLFEDRLGSRRLAVFYAAFQIATVVAVIMGLANLVSYKISAALVTKPESAWTTTERQSVADFRELQQLKLESQQTPESLPESAKARLAELLDRHARGELSSFISVIEPWWFYLLFNTIVALYIVKGGLAAAAINEAFQGVLIVVFSVILIPTGLAALGGWNQLATRLPAAAFDLFGSAHSSEFTGWTVAAVFLVTIIQTHALPASMAISGSARNEFAARVGGVTGTFGKRLTTIMWAFCGLIAMALYTGTDTLADADMAWGTMSRQLLGPGLLGLMLAGVLAAQMSTIAAQAMAASTLFARNLYGGLRPHATDPELVRAGRWALLVVLTIGMIISLRVSSVYSILQFALTMNVPFGASIMMMFIWRKVTTTAVWTAVLGSAAWNIVLPVVAPYISSIAQHPALVQPANDNSARSSAVFFDSVVRAEPDNPASALEGRGRLHTELLLLQTIGVNVSDLSRGGRLAGRFFVDALLPVLLVLGVSLFTRGPPSAHINQFFGRLKTPVGATPELDALAVEETRRAPHRFDHLKLWPSSSWEFTRWTTLDTLGFLVTCAITTAIIGLFVGLLRWAAP